MSDYFKSGKMFIVKFALKLVQFCKRFSLSKWVGVCKTGLIEISCLDLHV